MDESCSTHENIKTAQLLSLTRRWKKYIQFSLKRYEFMEMYGSESVWKKKRALVKLKLSM
jgi:hypothetical protein